ncbi:MAG TPA: CoA-binding protein [Candidatus Latescibacteria bacterium]|nr:CoA-binding protein [Candidatus Latescibacterota bacterium]HRU24372.1 CoA-binding protein [Candidatus Latescibacterota bacterium]
MPSIAIIGASKDRAKFGNKAVRAYVRQGYTVYPVNPKEREIEGILAYPSVKSIPFPVDRVALYVPPEIGIALLPEIAGKHPAELFVNPGAESQELLDEARRLGLEPIVACAIVSVGEMPD